MKPQHLFIVALAGLLFLGSFSASYFLMAPDQSQGPAMLEAEPQPEPVLLAVAEDGCHRTPQLKMPEPLIIPKPKPKKKKPARRYARANTKALPQLSLIHI